MKINLLSKKDFVKFSYHKLLACESERIGVCAKCNQNNSNVLLHRLLTCLCLKLLSTTGMVDDFSTEDQSFSHSLSHWNLLLTSKFLFRTDWEFLFIFKAFL